MVSFERAGRSAAITFCSTCSGRFGPGDSAGHSTEHEDPPKREIDEAHSRRADLAKLVNGFEAEFEINARKSLSRSKPAPSRLKVR